MEDGSVIHYRMGHVVVRSLGVFYTENGLLGLRGLYWIQGDLNVLIGLLQRIGLEANIFKSNTAT